MEFGNQEINGGFRAERQGDPGTINEKRLMPEELILTSTREWKSILTINFLLSSPMLWKYNSKLQFDKQPTLFEK